MTVIDALAYALGVVGLLYVIASISQAGSPKVCIPVSPTPILSLSNFFLTQLDHIPAIGPSGPLTSFWGVIKFWFYSREMVLEGCKKVLATGLTKISNVADQ